jgi:hypothetical protein
LAAACFFFDPVAAALMAACCCNNSSCAFLVVKIVFLQQQFQIRSDVHFRQTDGDSLLHLTLDEITIVLSAPDVFVCADGIDGVSFGEHACNVCVCCVFLSRPLTTPCHFVIQLCHILLLEVGTERGYYLVHREIIFTFLVGSRRVSRNYGTDGGVAYLFFQEHPSLGHLDVVHDPIKIQLSLFPGVLDAAIKFEFPDPQ